jgi:hypothetical protein
VVDLHIHGVSEPTRRILSAEARARGESLQEYLLDLLDHECHRAQRPGFTWIQVSPRADVPAATSPEIPIPPRLLA